jgi:hypothetical protein
MRYFVLSCLLLAVLMASAKEESSDFAASGNGFLRVCAPKGEQPSSMEGVCVGYANGVVDGYDFAMAFVQAQHHEPVTGGFCPPDNITKGQQYRIAVKFMQDHPEKTHSGAASMVAQAMVAAFPCPQEKAPNK